MYFYKLKKLISLVVVLVFAFSSLSAPWVEAGFWEERRRAAQKLHGRSFDEDVRVQSGLSSEKYKLLAQLPQVGHVNFGVDNGASVGAGLSFNQQVTSSNLPASFSSSREAHSWISSLVLPFGSVRDIHLSNKPQAPFVIHVQDAHGIEEAQRNIASMVQGLQEFRGVQLVGIEGTKGDFLLEPYRDFPNASVRKSVADAFLKDGSITGPEYVGLTSAAAPVLWGMEDMALYEGNVQAFLDSTKEKERVFEILNELKQSAEVLKRTIFSKELKVFDAHMSAFEKHEKGLGHYVKYLTNTRLKGKKKSTPTPHINLLVQALDLEEKLDFKVVEKERVRLVEVLARKLSEQEISEMVNESLRYRMGRVGYGEYYGFLRGLCRRKSVTLAKFEQLSLYVDYVLVADEIDRDALLEELLVLEKEVQDSLVKSQEQMRLVQLSRDLGLLSKLTAHEMAPRDWRIFVQDKKCVLDIPEEIGSLCQKRGLASPGSLNGSLNDLLKPYENFCEYAVSRNQAIVQNLDQKMKGNGNEALDYPSAVLITGGFHTEGLTHLMRQKDMSYVVITPRITEIPKDHAYLDVFARDPMPLEKLLSGEKIFMTFPPALGRAWPSNVARRFVRERLMASLIVLHAGVKAEFLTLAEKCIDKAGLNMQVLRVFGEKFVSVVMRIKDEVFTFTRRGKDIFVAKKSSWQDQGFRHLFSRLAGFVKSLVLVENKKIHVIFSVLVFLVLEALGMDGDVSFLIGIAAGLDVRDKKTLDLDSENLDLSAYADFLLSEKITCQQFREWNKRLNQLYLEDRLKLMYLLLDRMNADWHGKPNHALQLFFLPGEGYIFGRLDDELLMKGIQHKYAFVRHCFMINYQKTNDSTVIFGLDEFKQWDKDTQGFGFAELALLKKDMAVVLEELSQRKEKWAVSMSFWGGEPVFYVMKGTKEEIQKIPIIGGKKSVVFCSDSVEMAKHPFGPKRKPRIIPLNEKTPWRKIMRTISPFYQLYSEAASERILSLSRGAFVIIRMEGPEMIVGSSFPKGSFPQVVKRVSLATVLQDKRDIEFSIGRSYDSDLIIPNELILVSGKHAKLIVRNEEGVVNVYLTDLSKNGTSLLIRRNWTEALRRQELRLLSYVPKSGGSNQLVNAFVDELIEPEWVPRHVLSAQDPAEVSNMKKIALFQAEYQRHVLLHSFLAGMDEKEKISLFTQLIRRAKARSEDSFADAARRMFSFLIDSIFRDRLIDRIDTEVLLDAAVYPDEGVREHFILHLIAYVKENQVFRQEFAKNLPALMEMLEVEKSQKFKEQLAAVIYLLGAENLPEDVFRLALKADPYMRRDVRSPEVLKWPHLWGNDIDFWSVAKTIDLHPGKKQEILTGFREEHVSSQIRRLSEFEDWVETAEPYQFAEIIGFSQDELIDLIVQLGTQKSEFSVSMSFWEDKPVFFIGRGMEDAIKSHPLYTFSSTVLLHSHPDDEADTDNLVVSDNDLEVVRMLSPIETDIHHLVVSLNRVSGSADKVIHLGEFFPSGEREDVRITIHNEAVQERLGQILAPFFKRTPQPLKHKKPAPKGAMVWVWKLFYGPERVWKRIFTDKMSFEDYSRFKAYKIENVLAMGIGFFGLGVGMVLSAMGYVDDQALPLLFHAVTWVSFFLMHLDPGTRARAPGNVRMAFVFSLGMLLPLVPFLFVNYSFLVFTLSNIVVVAANVLSFVVHKKINARELRPAQEKSEEVVQPESIGMKPTLHMARKDKVALDLDTSMGQFVEPTVQMGRKAQSVLDLESSMGRLDQQTVSAGRGPQAALDVEALSEQNLQSVIGNLKSLERMFRSLDSDSFWRMHERLRQISKLYKERTQEVQGIQEIKEHWRTMVREQVDLSDSEIEEWKEGSQINRFKVREKIGIGGFGVVYKAEDENGNMAALKTLNPDILLHEDENEKVIGSKIHYLLSALAFFELEARNLKRAQLVKNDWMPAPVFVEQGADYIAMEYVDGLTLNRESVYKSLTLEEAELIFEAVDIIHHEMSLIHHDLKSENIMLVRDERGRLRGAKVLDYGAAVLADRTSRELGDDSWTPGYVAPERMSGLLGNRQSDVYSMAVVLRKVLDPDLFKQYPDLKKMLDYMAPEGEDKTRMFPAHSRPHMKELKTILRVFSFFPETSQRDMSEDFMGLAMFSDDLEEFVSYMKGLALVLGPEKSSHVLEVIEKLNGSELSVALEIILERFPPEYAMGMCNKMQALFAEDDGGLGYEEVFGVGEEGVDGEIEKVLKSLPVASVFVNHYAAGNKGIRYWLGHPLGSPLWEWVFHVVPLASYFLGMDIAVTVLSGVALSAGFGFLHRFDQNGSRLSIRKRVFLSFVGLGLSAAAFVPGMMSGSFWMGVAVNVCAHFVFNFVDFFVSNVLFKSKSITRKEEIEKWVYLMSFYLKDKDEALKAAPRLYGKSRRLLKLDRELLTPEMVKIYMDYRENDLTGFRELRKRLIEELMERGVIDKVFCIQKLAPLFLSMKTGAGQEYLSALAGFVLQDHHEELAERYNRLMDAAAPKHGKTHERDLNRLEEAPDAQLGLLLDVINDIIEEVKTAPGYGAYVDMPKLLSRKKQVENILANRALKGLPSKFSTSWLSVWVARVFGFEKPVQAAVDGVAWLLEPLVVVGVFAGLRAGAGVSWEMSAAAGVVVFCLLHVKHVVFDSMSGEYKLRFVWADGPWVFVKSVLGYGFKGIVFHFVPLILLLTGVAAWDVQVLPVASLLTGMVFHVVYLRIKKWRAARIFAQFPDVPRALSSVRVRDKHVGLKGRAAVINEYLLGVKGPARQVGFDVWVGKPAKAKGQWEDFAEQTLEKLGTPSVNKAQWKLLEDFELGNHSGIGRVLSAARSDRQFRRLMAYYILEEIQAPAPSQHRILSLLGLLHGAGSSLFEVLNNLTPENEEKSIDYQKRDMDLMMNLAGTFVHGKEPAKQIDQVFNKTYDEARRQAVTYGSLEQVMAKAAIAENKHFIFDVSDLDDPEVDEKAQNEMIRKLVDLKKNLGDDFYWKVILVSKNGQVDLDWLQIDNRHVLRPSRHAEFFTPEGKISLKHIVASMDDAAFFDVLTLNADNIDQNGVNQYVRVLLLLGGDLVKDVSAGLSKTLKALRFTNIQA